ncbi:MAG: ATP-binding protein [Candidatus Cloacimonadota bacterium]
MRRLFILVFCIAMLILTACDIKERILTHKLEQDYIAQGPSCGARLLADIDGDGRDEVIGKDDILGPNTAMIIYSQEGKALAQFNIGKTIHTQRVLTDPRDGRVWIYQSYNDEEKVSLIAHNYTWKPRTTREDKVFEQIPRIPNPEDNPLSPWYGQLDPRIIVDLEGDGELELVCSAADGFKANPRGVVVYDLDSGRLKWQYRTPCNLTGIYVEDLDGDGTKEIIFGTKALKNSMEEINGLTDHNSYIVILDPRGETIYQSQVLIGYSTAVPALADIDKDGLQELVLMAGSWGNQEQRNSLTIYDYTNRRLVVQSQYSVPSTLNDIEPYLLVHQMDREGKFLITLVDSVKGLIVLDEKLNPINHGLDLSNLVILESVDLDEDGKKGLLVLTEDHYIMILDHIFRIRAKLKHPYPEDNHSYTHSIKRGFKEPMGLAVVSRGRITYLNYKQISAGKMLLEGLKAYSFWVMGFLLFLLLISIHLYQKRSDVYKILADNTHLGIVVTIGSDRIYRINRMAEELLSAHAPAETLMGRKYLSSIFPELHSTLLKFAKSKRPALKTLQKFTIGDLVLDSCVSYVRAFSYRTYFLVGFTTNSTDNDKHSRELLWAETARRLSHNVRRHITNIILALEPLDSDELSSVDRAEYLKIIKDETERIRVFTHAFQRFSELKDYELKLQDIIPSVEHCLARIKIPQGIKVIKNWSLSSIEALIEPIRFEEALSNMIINALESMSEEGVLHISVKKVPLHGSGKENLPVLIEIEDSGKGISKQNMEDIFKPFFTTKAAGTGIGLPETKKIIESMHGELELRSEESSGTVVSIWLKGE